jgi:hypothetical protein
VAVRESLSSGSLFRVILGDIICSTFFDHAAIRHYLVTVPSVSLNNKEKRIAFCWKENR